jgi:hypothetical protein
MACSSPEIISYRKKIPSPGKQDEILGFTLYTAIQLAADKQFHPGFSGNPCAFCGAACRAITRKKADFHGRLTLPESL